ncbi:MAG TPA: hypothetical protein VMW01_01565 [Williamwhitmania sp.]|nr:hypothetical protein [Williamwhitmania sp.]
MIDIPEDIKQLYSQIDSISSFDSWELLEKITPLDNRQNDEWQDKIKIERKVLGFYINKGDLFPKIVKVNSAGDVDSYPNSNSFVEAEIEYLKDRLNVSPNFWIKSRYSHILWTITKNNIYAVRTLEYYLEIVNFIKDKEDLESNYSLPSIIECILP